MHSKGRSRGPDLGSSQDGEKIALRLSKAMWQPEAQGGTVEKVVSKVA